SRVTLPLSAVSLQITIARAMSGADMALAGSIAPPEKRLCAQDDPLRMKRKSEPRKSPDSLAAPADSVFCDFDQDSGFGEFCPDPVGFLEFASGPGGFHFSDSCLDFGIGALRGLECISQLLADVFLPALGLSPFEDLLHLRNVVIVKNGEDFVELV